MSDSERARAKAWDESPEKAALDAKVSETIARGLERIAAIPAAPTWRIGRKLSRTIYFQDRCVGMVDTPGLAIILVTAANERDERRAVDMRPNEARADKPEGCDCWGSSTCSRCDPGGTGKQTVFANGVDVDKAEAERRDVVPALTDARIDVLASRAGGAYVGAPATRDEERAMAVEIRWQRNRSRPTAHAACEHRGCDVEAYALRKENEAVYWCGRCGALWMTGGEPQLPGAFPYDEGAKRTDYPHADIDEAVRVLENLSTIHCTIDHDHDDTPDGQECPFKDARVAADLALEALRGPSGMRSDSPRAVDKIPAAPESVVSAARKVRDSLAPNLTEEERVTAWDVLDEALLEHDRLLRIAGAKVAE